MDVVTRDGREPFVMTDNLMHATLAVQLAQGGADLAARELLHHRLQGLVLLAHDVVKVGGLHAGRLQLLIRSARLDGLVLAHVAHQEQTIAGLQAVQQRMHLLRARETGLVEDVQVRPRLVRLVSPDEMAL